MKRVELQKKPKYIFLITIDCLRADALGCITKGNLTPNIDRLAEDSVLFTRAFANGPGTNQSFPAILSSTYFLVHGGMRLLPHYTTLAEALSNNGFKTVAFHSNPFLSKSLGWSRGFSEFYDFMDILESPSAAVTRSDYLATVIKIIDRATGILHNEKLQSILRMAYYGHSQFEIPYIDGRELNTYAIKWINQNRGRKFFIWMHYMDPHRPYIPPPPHLLDFATRKEAFIFDASIDPKISQGNVSNGELKTLRRLYEGEVRYVDHCVGSFKQFLESRGLLQDSLVILAADHGEAFTEHNRLAHAPDIVYNELIHVPLVMHGLTDDSAVFNDYVELLDIPPTVLDKLGIGKPHDFMGNTMIPTLEGDGEYEFIFSESAKPDLINLRYDTRKIVVSCIAVRWELIIKELWRTAELYNLEKDFNERTNVIQTERDIYEELKSLIRRHLRHVHNQKLEMKSKTRGL